MVSEMINVLKPGRKFLATLVVFWLAVPLAVAQTSLQGMVVGVADGDTLTILMTDKSKVRVRLAAIDAPERKQAFGTRAKQALSTICFGKSATVNVIQIDRYARSVGEVFCEGRHANAEMVRAGLAWVYRRYAKEGYDGLYVMEREAMAAGIGLWVDPSPTPPWEWRKNKL